MKGVSPLLSTVLVILISVAAISAVLLVGGPSINRARESAIIGEAYQNMRTINNFITEVASENPGSLRKVPIKVTEGTYRVISTSGSFEYDLGLTSDILPLGSIKKEGNLQTIVGGSAKASQNSTYLILENEILEIVFYRNGSETNFDSINTSTLIRTIKLKDSGFTLRPNDTGIVIGNYSNSSWGIGYSKLVSESTQLAKAEVLAHVRSNLTNHEYEVLYTLPASADFLIINIKNVSNNQTTVNFIYHLGNNATSDVIRMGGVNEGLSSLNNSLSAWWKFSEGNGTSTIDNSGYGNTGTINGNVTWLTNSSCLSGFGYCLSFTRTTNSLVKVINSPSLNPRKELTLEAWINLASPIPSWTRFISKGLETGISQQYEFTFQIDGPLRFMLVTSTANTCVWQNLTTNTWHHVVGTYDGSQMKIYVNGSLKQTCSATGDINTTTQNLWFGGYNGVDGEFPGIIDNVKIFSRALSSDEIKAEYDNSLEGPFLTGCYTSANLSSFYACSYENVETQAVSTGLIYSGAPSNFVKACFFNQTYNDYKFNLTANGQTKIILPFSLGTCQKIDDKMTVIKSQDLPSFAFGTYNIKGEKILHLSLIQDRIKLTGSGKFGPGTHSICFQKTGQENFRAVVNVTSC